MREALDRALNQLLEESLRMLSLVREMTQEATEALVQADRAKALALGADAFLAKPFGVQDLMAEARRLLSTMFDVGQ